jgi:hypothetical protein
MHDDGDEAITVGDLDSVIGLLLLLKEQMGAMEERLATAVAEVEELVEAMRVRKAP